MLLKQFKTKFKKFWNTDNSKLSLLRDVFVALAFVFIIIGSLWIYTGQWFATPMVAIESGSMMHRDEPYGRYGTIDAGDMVLLVKVDSLDDIVPLAEKDDNNYYYGNYGDVIVYQPLGDEHETPIIHRAMCWVEVEFVNGQKTYTIEEYGIINHPANQPLYAPELGIRSLSRPHNGAVTVNWSHSGFITKGDNPDSNPTCDQIGGLCDEPVKLEWVTGKARMELPWIGTINLLFNDITGGQSTVGNVPSDSITCLIILITVLVSIPVGLDVYSYYQEKNQKKPEEKEIKTYYKDEQDQKPKQ